MLTKVDKDWFNAAWRRAVRTFAQAFLGSIGSAAVFSEVDWKAVALSAAFSTILAILMALNGLPEASTDGKMVVNTTDPAKDVYSFELDGDPAALAEKNSVAFKVVKE